MRLVILLLVTSLALGACGRRGALQPPPGIAAVGQPGAAAATSEPAAAADKPDTPFILDALI